MRLLLPLLLLALLLCVGLAIAGFEGGTGRFLLPADPRLSRGGGIVCGQAIAAAADTCSVLALKPACFRTPVQLEG